MREMQHNFNEEKKRVYVCLNDENKYLVPTKFFNQRFDT